MTTMIIPDGHVRISGPSPMAGMDPINKTCHYSLAYDLLRSRLSHRHATEVHDRAGKLVGWCGLGSDYKAGSAGDAVGDMGWSGVGADLWIWWMVEAYCPSHLEAGRPGWVLVPGGAP